MLSLAAVKGGRVDWLRTPNGGRSLPAGAAPGALISGAGEAEGSVRRVARAGRAWRGRAAAPTAAAGRGGPSRCAPPSPSSSSSAAETGDGQVTAGGGGSTGSLRGARVSPAPGGAPGTVEGPGVGF